MLSQVELQKLVQMAQSGDDAAIAKLIEWERIRLIGRLRSMLNDEQGIQDIVQNTLIRVARHIKQYDSRRGSFANWANSILHNELMRWLAARKQRVISILLEPELSDAVRRDLLARAQTALNQGHKVRFEVRIAAASREETYRAEDTINEWLADLDCWNNPPEIPFMKFDDQRFITEVASTKRKRLPPLSLSRITGEADSSDIDIPVEHFDVDDGGASSAPEILPPALYDTLVSLVADKRLLRMTCEGSYPWQVVMFCFNKLFVWKPKRIVKELLHQTLHSSRERLEMIFSETFHHALGRLVEFGVKDALPEIPEEHAVAAIGKALEDVRKDDVMQDFDPLRKRMGMSVQSLLLKEDGVGPQLLAPILNHVVGETRLAAYFVSDPADSVPKISDKVRKKVIEISVRHLNEHIPALAEQSEV